MSQVMSYETFPDPLGFLIAVLGLMFVALSIYRGWKS